MAYIRFDDTTENGADSDVYIYQGANNQYVVHIWETASKEIAHLPTKASEQWITAYDSTESWRSYRYTNLAALMEDMESFAKYINVPEILFDRLEQQDAEDREATHWANAFYAHYKMDAYPSEDEQPVFSDVEPYEQNGLRAYVERIAPMLEEIIGRPVGVWESVQDKENRIADTLKVLVRDAGVDEIMLEPNWYIETIQRNAAAVCYGTEPEYNNFLDENGEIFFMSNKEKDSKVLA